MSSNKLLLVVFLVVMGGLIGGIVYMSTHPRNSPLAKTQRSTQFNQAETTVPTSPTSTQAGSSDAKLEKDSTAIDDSMNALDTELSNIDSSLLDQQTNLQ